MSNDTDLAALAARLAQMERSNRRLRMQLWALFVVALLFAAGAWMVQKGRTSLGRTASGEV